MEKKQYKVTLVKGKTFRLDHGHKYLLILDPKVVSVETAKHLQAAFKDLGISLIVAWLEKDSYQLIQEKE
jgi:hypothetical protein